MENLFIYGTLKDPEIQLSVIGRLIEGTEALLTGYKISSLTSEGETYPLIVPEPENTVEGRLICVSPAELEKIDIYETEAYRRVKVNLTSGITAWVYL